MLKLQNSNNIASFRYDSYHSNHSNLKSLANFKASKGIQIDSAKILCNFNAIRDIDHRHTIEQICTDCKNGNLIKSLRLIKSDSLPYGVKSIQINELTSEVMIELSAKILLDRYNDLITINTIKQALDNLNKTKGISFDTNCIIDKGMFCKVDVANDLNVLYDPADYISVLQFFSVNDRFFIEAYKDQSIVFRSCTKSKKRRLIFYRKYPELLKKENNRLLKYGLLENYKQVIRVEQNIVTFEAMRKAFQVEEPYIKSLLESKSKPNYDLFQNIKTKVTFSLLEKYRHKDISYHDIVKREGMKTIAKECLYDVQLIKLFIKHYVKGNVSRYVREYKTLLADMKNEILIENNQSELIEEIEYLLKIA